MEIMVTVIPTSLNRMGKDEKPLVKLFQICYLGGKWLDYSVIFSLSEN